jgi:hypothetical protein
MYTIIFNSAPKIPFLGLHRYEAAFLNIEKDSL